MNSSSHATADPPLSIILFIRSLSIGGTERQVVELAKGLALAGHQVKVAVFYGGGAFDRELAVAGIPIVDLGKRGRWDMFAFTARFVRLLRSENPDILYCFLGTANSLGAIVKPFLRRTRLIWGVRSSYMDLSSYGWASRLSYRAECFLARYADRIISNSGAGATYAEAHGFPRGPMRVVPNGIDTDRFRPNPELRKRAREAFGLQDSDVAIGVLARLDPIKDQGTFLRAAALLASRHPNFRFLCIGEGPEEIATQLTALADELGIGSRVRLTGRWDSAEALNGLDICCLSSAGEGFSNSLAEAMACGVPCVSTDVGDSRMLIGDSGVVVPRRDPAALAQGIEDLSGLLGTALSGQARQRIVESYSIATMVGRTLDVMRESQAQARSG